MKIATTVSIIACILACFCFLGLVIYIAIKTPIAFLLLVASGAMAIYKIDERKNKE